MGTAFVVTLIEVEHDALGTCMGKIQSFLNCWARVCSFYRHWGVTKVT